MDRTDGDHDDNQSVRNTEGDDDGDKENESEWCDRCILSSFVPLNSCVAVTGLD